MTTTLKRLLSKSPDMSAVIARFPVAVLSMAVLTLIIVVLDVNFNGNDTIGRLCVGLIIAAYTSVSMTLAAEGADKSRRLWLQGLVAVVICALAWFSESLRLNLIMAVGAVVLGLGNAVRWRRGRDDIHVWDFTHKLWTGALFATVGSIIFLLGMLAIMAALKVLFGVDMDKLLEDIILPIAFGFLAPLYWLSTLPPADEDYAELYDNPSFVSKSVAFLGTWLLAPLTLIYALILLAYGVKIGLSMSLPKGEIAGLTLPFLIIGTLTWLVLEPPFIRAKALAKLFRRLWFPLSIPAATLLGIAVFVRIREYGYTPERFALTIGVTWALAVGLWFTFGPKLKRDIRLIPGFAAALLLLGTFSAGWLSQVNQGMRFESGLKQAGIMSAAGVVADPVVITDMDAARKAKGAFQYLMRQDGETRAMAVLENSGLDLSVSDHADAMHPIKEHQSRIETALGFDKVSSPNRWGREGEIIFNRQNRSRSVAEFDLIHGPVSIYNHNGEQSLSPNSSYTGTIEDGVLTLKIGDEEPLVFDAIAWIDAQGFGEGTITADSFEIEILNEENRAVTLSLERFNRWTDIRSGNDAPGDRLTMDFYILTRGLD